jgi:hypothetical protein
MRLLSVPPQIAGRRTRAKVKSGRSHRQRHNCNYFGQPSRLMQLVSCDKFLPEVSRGFGLRIRTPPCGWDRYSGMLQRLCRGSAGCTRNARPEIFPYDLFWSAWCSRQRLTGRFRSGQNAYSTVLPRSSRTYVLPFSKQTPVRRQHFKTRGEREYRGQRGQQPQDRGSFNSKLAKTPIAHPTNHRCS